MGKDDELLQKELAALKGASVNFAYRFISDPEMRQQYLAQIQGYTRDLLKEVEQKHITAQAASAETVYLRNQAVDIARGIISGSGLAITQQKKAKRPSLADLQESNSQKLFKLRFQELANNQKNQVWLNIAKSYSRDNSFETCSIKIRSNLGKGCLLFAGAISVYHIYNLENRPMPIAREPTQFGGTIGGTVAGRLGAGSIGCGIGAFVSGLLGALDVSELESYFVPQLAARLGSSNLAEQKARRISQGAAIPNYFSLLLNKAWEQGGPNFDMTAVTMAYSAELFSQTVTVPVSNLSRQHPKDTKWQQAEKLVSSIGHSLEQNQEVNAKELQDLNKLMLEEVLPVVDAVLNNFTQESIIGFEKETDIVQCRKELDTLRSKNSPKEEQLAKAQELKNKKVVVDERRQQFNEKLQYINQFTEGLSLIGFWIKNVNMQKAAVVLTALAGIGQNVSALAGTGTLAATITPIGGALAIAGCLGSILGAFSSGDNKAIEAILSSIQKLSEQMNQLRTEMHQRFGEVMQGLSIVAHQQFDYFCSLKNSLNSVSAKIDHLHQEQQRAHQQEIGSLETLAQNLETTAIKAKSKNKSDKVKALIIEITQKRKAVDIDRSKYSDLRAALSSYLTCAGMGMRLSDFTGSDCPDLKNASQLILHLDDFPVTYHYGTLAKLYREFKLENRIYSSFMMNTYLQQSVKDKPYFQLHNDLTIADLQLMRHHEQNKVSGLELAIKEFLLADAAENPADTLIIPLCLQAKWQLILINKSFQQVSLFTAPYQVELQQRLFAVIKHSVPKDFVYRHIAFPENISPIYYGTILVEIVRCLTNGELYDEVLEKATSRRLEDLYQDQKKIFQPDEKLLATNAATSDDMINPAIGELFSLHLLEIYYYIYPEVSIAKKIDLTVKKAEVDDIRNALLNFETPYQLYQACCDENLLEVLFRKYKEAARELKSEVTHYRSAYENRITARQNAAAKERLSAKFLDEKIKAQFEQPIATKAYGNWFLPMYCKSTQGESQYFNDATEKSFPLITLLQDEDERWGTQPPDIPFMFPLVAKGATHYVEDAKNFATSSKKAYIRGQAEKIRKSKQSFVQNATEDLSKLSNFGKIDVYNKNAYTHSILPCFILPEQEGNPVLPNKSFGSSLIPDTILQAQTMGCGCIDLRYYVDVTNNQFIVKCYFLMENYTLDSCFAIYSTKYNRENAAINFYDGQEAIWWFWSGGNVPSQLNFPQDYNGVGGIQSQFSSGGEKYLYGYITTPEIELKGACALPASSLTKVVDVISSASHPLTTEIHRRLNAKYLEMQTALNHELSAGLTNQAASLGKALLKFEQTYRTLKLFLEFIFPSSMSNPNDSIYALLHHEDVIYNKQRLLAYLSNQTEKFVVTKIVNDTLIDLLQRSCLILLPQQIHNNLPRIAALEQELLQAYDDFLSFQAGEDPTLQETSQFELVKSKLYEKKAQLFQDMSMHLLNMISQGLSPERVAQENARFAETNSFVKHIEDMLHRIEANFKSGKVNLSDSFKQLRLCLSAPSATSSQNAQQELSKALLELMPAPQKKKPQTAATESSYVSTGTTASFFVAPTNAPVTSAAAAATTSSVSASSSTLNYSSVSAGTISSNPSSFDQCFQRYRRVLEATGTFSASANIDSAAAALAAADCQMHPV